MNILFGTASTFLASCSWSGYKGSDAAKKSSRFVPTSAPSLNVRSSLSSPEAVFSTTDENHKAFECKVVGIDSDWTSCDSPYDLSSLVDRGFEGEFKVRSVGSGKKAEGPEASQAFLRGIPANGVNGSVTAVAYASDGSKILGGSFTVFKQHVASGMAMLQENGDYAHFLDQFGGGSASAFAIQSDGKILVGGGFTSYGGNSSAPDGLMRFNADGSEDTLFNTNAGTGFASGGPSLSISALVVQSDGKILVGGVIYTYNGSLIPYGIVRLNANGTLDTEFVTNAGSGVSSDESTRVLALGLQSDGKILVGGYINGFNGDDNAPDHLLRLNADGTEDSAFRAAAAGQGMDYTVQALVVQSDDKIVVGGSFNNYAAADVPNYILRLNADGSEDTAFSALAGVGFDGVVTALAVQDDGMILVGGTFSSYAGDGGVPNRILRLTSSGAVDGDFSANAGVGMNASVASIALDSTGKILLGGQFTSYAGNAAASDLLLRLNTDGTVDATLSLSTGFNGTVSVVVAGPDGRLLVGGDFSNYGGSSIPANLLRLNADGSEDTTFSANAGAGISGSYGYINDLVVQSDGKILVGGNFTSYAGSEGAPDCILRLNADGSVDTAFHTNAGTGFNSGEDAGVSAIVLQSDGKIVVGGGFSTYDDEATPLGILRLNSDGSVDAAFSSNAGTGFNTGPSKLALQSDGKIIVGSAMGDFNGITMPNHISRLNGDGTVDADFSTQAGIGLDFPPITIEVQSDGKILIGGFFTSYAGNTAAPNHFLRLNTDGSEDTSFNTNLGTGPNDAVRSIALQENGKILIGGGFTAFDGDAEAPNSLLRLNIDGSEDTDFRAAVGVGFSSSVYAIALDSEENVLAAGQFSVFNEDVWAKNFYEFKD